jgi:putative DNA primase/helicase
MAAELLTHEQARAQFERESEAVNLDITDPMACARTVVQTAYQACGMRAIVYWQEEFWNWRDGAWQSMPTSEVSAKVYAFLERAGEKTTRRKVGDIIDALRAVAYLNTSYRPPVWLDDPARDTSDILVCRNGVIDLKTNAMAPISPALFCLSALPVEFDPDAGEPAEWTKFLDSVWPEDCESRQTLQEIAGLLLTPTTKFQKIFLIVGPRRSGKGTILRTLTAMLGPQNVSAPTLSSLGLPFGLQPLVGKLAAFIADARLGGRSDQSAITERLLSISGEDNVAVPRKFLPDYTARLPVRFVLSTNELPRLSDSSGALAGRFVVLLMQESFYGKEDLGLEERLRPELPGILKWCLAGRRRLLERGHFVQPVSAAGAIEQLEDLGSPISAFVRDACEVGSGLSIGVEELYGAWRAWCEAAGRDRPGSAQTFGRDLRATCPGLKVVRPRDQDGDRTRKYEGIRLRSSPGAVRSGPRSSALQSHTHARYACNGDVRGPARTNCPNCDGEGCQWCQGGER